LTLSDLLTRGRAATRAWWFLPLLVLLAALWLAWRLNAGREAESTARRLAEEQLARSHDLLVVEQGKRRDVEADAKRLAAGNADLAAELARARKVVPGARVVGAASSSTGALPAGGAPRPNWPCSPATPCEVVHLECAGAQGPAKPSGPVPPAPLEVVHPACLLAAGDEGEIRVDQVVLDGTGGARLVVGAASAYRVTPEPRARLFGGPFRAALSEASAEAPVAQPGWGAGIFVGLSRDGWAAGPALAAPPFRLFGVQVEAVAGAGLGSNGIWAGSGTALVRW